MIETFEERFLRLFARALGLTADDLRRDYAMTAMNSTVQRVVGYNPQKLLPPPETARPLTMKEWVSLFYGSEIGDFIADRTFLDEEIIFHGRRPRDYVNFNPIYDETPSETELRRLISPPRTPTFRHKIAVIKAEDEERLLDRYLERSALVGGLIERRYYPLPEPEQPPEPEDKVVETSAGKRNMAYLKHDRTKRHNRRRR